MKINKPEIKSINKPAPKDWDELFKWYPPGKFILKNHTFNMSGNKSIYDDAIGKVNVDSESDISTKYGITSIPTLLFFKDGEIVDKHIGPASKLELENKLNALI